MSDRRAPEERLLSELHAARLEGSLERLTGLVSGDARLRITGSSEGRAVSIAARGGREIRACRALLVKAFALRGYQLLSLTVEGERAAAAHWRVEIHSKITGARVPTELVDLLKVRNGRIASCVEFFVPDAPA